MSKSLNSSLNRFSLNNDHYRFSNSGFEKGNIVEEVHEPERSGSKVISELQRRSGFDNRPSESVVKMVNSSMNNLRDENNIAEGNNMKIDETLISSNDDEDTSFEVDEK